MANRDIQVIGASAGGIGTLTRLLGLLPEGCEASIFVVQHVAPDSAGSLPQILQRSCKLPVLSPDDGASIEPGKVYVARPDKHLVLEQGRIRVVRGPKENLHRPAVDVTFRSAAWIYGPRVAGIVLSGLLDDGSAGLWAIKSCGGIAIVQDPADAQFPDMPANALRLVEVDHCLSVEKMGPILCELAREPARDLAMSDSHAKLAIEVDLAQLRPQSEEMDRLGTPTVFSCPACHGALWEMKNGELLVYRCHTGHAFGPEGLLNGQSEAVEVALYSALRAVQEKARASRRIGDSYGTRFPEQAARMENAARTLEQNANVIRALIAALD